jgi:hypothetical protein
MLISKSYNIFDCELHEQMRNVLDLNRINVIMIHMFNRNVNVVISGEVHSEVKSYKIQKKTY